MTCIDTADIAVLSDSASDTICHYSNRESCTKRCQYYMNNTMNYNAKGYCDVDHNLVSRFGPVNTTARVIVSGTSLCLMLT